MNHIENIEIKNFKSIKHATINDCRRVNVFIGYPNVGKSNILEAIGLYSTTYLSELEFFYLNSLCRLNRFSDLFFNKNTDERAEIGLNDFFSLEFIVKENTPELDLRISSNNKAIRIFQINFGENFKYKTYHHVPEKYSESIVCKIKYYHFDKNIDTKEKKGTSLSVPNGDNLLDILHGNSFLRAAYLELLEAYNLKLFISETDINVAKELSDGSFLMLQHNLLSDTLRRLLFYKAAIITNKNSVLLFEEPEAHMFPPYISKLTSDIVNDENHNQFFLTTHSPFVMNDLISNVEKDELSIYIVSYENETGETLIHRMSDEDVNEAYQFGYDFFMNIDNFIPKKQHD